MPKEDFITNGRASIQWDQRHAIRNAMHKWPIEPKLHSKITTSILLLDNKEQQQLKKAPGIYHKEQVVGLDDLKLLWPICHSSPESLESSILTMYRLTSQQVDGSKTNKESHHSSLQIIIYNLWRTQNNSVILSKACSIDSLTTILDREVCWKRWQVVLTWETMKTIGKGKLGPIKWIEKYST